MRMSANVHVTDACQYDCDICFEDKSADPKYLDPFKLLKFVADVGIEHVGFVGGECTLHPQLFYLLNELRTAGVHTCVVTNGDNLNVLDVMPGRLSIGVGNDDQSIVDDFLEVNKDRLPPTEITITPTDIAKADALIAKYQALGIPVNISLLAFWNRNYPVNDYITPDYVAWAENLLDTYPSIRVFGEQTSERIADFYQEAEVDGRQYYCWAPLNVFADGTLAYCDLKNFPLLHGDGRPMTYIDYDKERIIKPTELVWNEYPCKACSLRRTV